jgi:3-keto-disaccharide hydrolase
MSRPIALSLFFCLGTILTPQETHAQAAGLEPQLSASESVFDGQSLEGWVTQGGRYDGSAKWTVEDGALVGRQGPKKSGGLIYTERAYRNAIISFETRIDHPFDSGVFLRMTPRGGKKGAQVTLDYRPGGEVGAIYADGFLHHEKEAKAKFKRDAWNKVTVRILGENFRLTFWLNGELITDYRLPADRASEFAASGLIGLQVHGGENVPDSQAARFRKIRLRELPCDFDPRHYTMDDRGHLALTAAGLEEGWRPLFDGRSLDGWEIMGGDGKGGYVARNGVLAFTKEGGDGYLRTKADYRDFELRLDFRIARMCNSGLFLRANRKGGNPAYSGCEIQILDDFNWERVTKSRLQPYQFTGGLYGSLAPGVRNAMKPLGAWNTYLVRYQGDRIACRLNGHLLWDVKTSEVPAKPPFAERAKTGAIGLQRHAPAGIEGDYAWFRNLFVRELR